MPPENPPPVDPPPADTPPADIPPADTPPADTPPADTPPADTPPADTPPADPGAAIDSMEFTAPEGVTIDETLAVDLKGIAKQNGWTPEVTQAVADLGSQMLVRQAEANKARSEQWKSEVLADPEIGGASMEQNLALARKGLAELGSPELVEFLDATSLGNHPALVKAFYKAAKLIGEDRLEHGRQSPDPATLTTGQIMYPGMVKKQ